LKKIVLKIKLLLVLEVIVQAHELGVNARLPFNLSIKLTVTPLAHHSCTTGAPPSHHWHTTGAL